MNEITKTSQNLSPVTIEDIKKYICPTATESELNFAFQICKTTGLNPFLRELHIIKYGNSPAQIVTGYTEYIKRAERTGKLNGWSVKLSDDKKTATCIILRKDWSTPFEWSVDFDEVNRKQSTWQQIPVTMLKKTAISQAFRLCFPDETANLPFTQEEQELTREVNVTPIAKHPGETKTEKVLNTLKAAEVPAHTTQKINAYQPEHPQSLDIYEDEAEQQQPITQQEVKQAADKSDCITEAQRKRFYAIAKKAGKTDDQVKAFLFAKYGIDSTKDIPWKGYDEACKWAENQDDNLQF